MLSLAAYAIEAQRPKAANTSEKDGRAMPMEMDTDMLMNLLTRGAFVWMDMYIVISAMFGYKGAHNVVEFQQWLIVTMLTFCMLTAIGIVMVYCMNKADLKVMQRCATAANEQESEKSEAPVNSVCEKIE